MFEQMTIDELLADPPKRMNVLLACEESQAVCTEFRKLGHRAFSCDIQECSGGHPEWHIMGDALKLISRDCKSFATMDGCTHTHTKWDMIIAFPPCTHLAVSGARHFEKKRADGRQREGVEFFCQFLNADCDKVAIENPVGIVSGDYILQHFPDIAEKYGLPRKPTQVIQPWMFGDNARKTTCLWLKGIPPLKPAVTEEPELEFFEWICSKTGRKKRQPLWYYKAYESEDRGKTRSKTFLGVARAMAEQWGGDCN